MYVLDTDILALYQMGAAAVTTHVAAVPESQIAITILTVEEQLSGWYTMLRRARRREELARAYQRFTDNVQFVSRLQVPSFSESAIEIFEHLKSLKLGVRAMDLRIAAVALEHHAIVVTRNRRDFAVVPGLTIEDWTA